MKRLILLSAFALGLTSHVVNAQESGYYLGIGLGKSAIDFNGDDFGTQSVGSIKSTVTGDTGYKLFGGYNLNENWAIEIGYADMGRFAYKWTATTGALYKNNIYAFDYKASSLFAAAKGTLLVTGRLNVFGKLGVAVNKSENAFALDNSRYISPPLAPCLDFANPNSCYPAFSTSAIYANPGNHENTRSDVLLGVGVEYRVHKNVSIRLEYEDFGRFGDQDNTGRAKLSLWSLGTIYEF